MNGNTHGRFGLGLSEVVWHVGGPGWLVVTGGLVDCVVLKVGLVELVVLRSEKMT